MENEKNVMHLDMMSEKDLKQLYKNSALLWWGGNFYLILIIVTCGSFCYLFKKYSGDIEFLNTIPLLTLLFIFINVFSFAALYCFKYARGISAHIFFFFNAIILIFAGLVPSGDNNISWCQLITVAGLVNLIPVFSLKLIRAKNFSHKQIAAAWKKMKKDEEFTDEDLPPNKTVRWLTILCLVFEYIVLGAVLLYCVRGIFLQ